VAQLFLHHDSAARLSLWETGTNDFRCHIYGLTNRYYRVDATTNLKGPTVWTPVFKKMVSFWYTNACRTNNWAVFYRAITN
jgi:hypothetical protein